MEQHPESQNQTPISNDTPVHESPKNSESMLGEIIRFSLVALLIVLPIRIFVAQPFIVSGASMESTFSTGQYLIVDQLTYHFEEPKRGEVIIFRYPKDPSKFFIKRIIGIPGDTVSISGNEVTIINEANPEGVRLDETYVHSMRPNATITENLGKGEYFVMGDNRDASSDSRAWGVLQRDHVVGRAFLRLFPFTKLNVFPGAHDITTEMKL
jgi:signal peptidase I